MYITGKIDKGWGYEDIWVSNEKYCSKFLHFKKDAKFSMHFHAEKEETWYIMSGEFLLRVIDLDEASQHEFVLSKGEVWHNKKLQPHQLVCVEEGTVLEVSTPDSIEDNYRILPGDSQT